MSKRDDVFPWPRTADDETPLGIDLATKAADVRLIVLKHFSSGHALDMDDLVQEVHLAIARKNHQRCAFDPRRSAFGHYVFIVAQSTLRNELAKARRIASHESPGKAEILDPDDPIGAFEDVTSDPEIDVEATRGALERAIVYDRRDAVRVVRKGVR